MRRIRSVRSYLYAVLLVAGTGCASWHTRPGPAEAVVGERHPRAVRVTRTDRSVVVLRAPEVRDDSIVGLAGTGADTTRVAVATGDVQRLEVRRKDVARTTGLVLGGALVGVSLLTVMAFAALMGSWQ